MYTLVMDRTGDSRNRFDPTNNSQVLEAQRRDCELSKAGYTAAKRAGSGRSELIREFDLNETVFFLRLMGG